MSNDSNRDGGSDLDLFEGLGKKGAEDASEAASPTGSSTSAQPSAAPFDAKKTLLGIPGPAVHSAPPSGPDAANPSPSRIPAPSSVTPSTPAADAGATAKQADVSDAPSQRSTTARKNGAKLDMDWDDDNEETHVFDKDKDKTKENAPGESHASAEAPEPRADTRAKMDALLGGASKDEDLATRSESDDEDEDENDDEDADDSALSGAFGALGLRDKPNAGKLIPGPPASLRETPPPPATSKAAQPVPPPPPPGSQAAAPRTRAASAIGTVKMPAISSVPPPPSSAPPSSDYPSTAALRRSISRAAELSRFADPPQKKTPMAAIIVAAVGVVGAAVFFLMPRTGTLVVNVADAKGAAVPNLEVVVDGTKRCEGAPCIIRDISAGVHEVKVAAKGYDMPAPRAVTVESRRDVPTDFQLVPSKSGAGFRVATRPGLKFAIDGKEMGPLPQEVRDIEPGEHTIRFYGDRYSPVEKTITVAKDQMVDIGPLDLKVTKGKATIQLNTPGAKVYLVNGTNRKEVPQFPMAIEFDPAEKWELQSVKEGFDEYREMVSFDDGIAEKTFSITLSPKGTAAKAAAVAPAAPREPAAPAPKAATNPPATPAKEPAPAAAGTAILKINSLPASTITLDGKKIGVTPQPNVPVSPGSHTIVFTNDELSLKKTIAVEVKAGETKAAFVKLRE